MCVIFFRFNKLWYIRFKLNQATKLMFDPTVLPCVVGDICWFVFFTLN